MEPKNDYTGPPYSLEDADYVSRPVWKTIKIINLVFSVAALIAFWILNGFFRSQMFESSADFSADFLANYPKYEGWAFIWTNISYAISRAAVFFLLILLRRKHNALLLFLAVTLENATSEAIKLIMRDTRPCFQRQSIADHFCTCSFGQASGHSSNAVVFYLLLFPLFFEDFHRGYLANALFLLGMVLIIFNVCMSRIFYGAHAYNQVILGLLIGYLFFSLVWLFQRPLQRLVAETLAHNPRRLWQRRVFFVLVFLAYVVMNALGLGFWGRNRLHYEQFPGHPTINSTCEGVCLGRGKWLSDSHLESIALSSSGGWLALLFALFLNSPTQSSDRFYRDTWSSFLMVLKRLVLDVLIVSPAWVGLIFLTFLKGWVYYIVMTFMSLLFACSFFWLQPPLARLMRCQVEGDFFGPVPAPAPLHSPAALEAESLHSFQQVPNPFQ